MRNTTLYLLISCFAFGASGCGQNAAHRVPVSGRVLIDGQPLTDGTIRLVPESGRPVSSAIMADGSFDLAAERVDQASEPGVPCGNYRVQVSASKIVDDKTILWHAPEKYADFRTSGLNVTIDKPTDQLVIELTSVDEDPPTEDPAADDAGDPPKANGAASSPTSDQPSSDGEGTQK